MMIKKVAVLGLLALFLGMVATPVINAADGPQPRPLAILTISSDVTFGDYYYNYTDGVTVTAGATLTINPNGTFTKLNFGTAGAGNLIIEDDSRLIVHTSNTKIVYLGGNDSSSRAGTINFYGEFEQYDTGDGTRYNLYIGVDEIFDETILGAINMRNEFDRKFTNVIMDSDSFWTALVYQAEGGYFINSEIRGQRAGHQTAGEMWMENCTIGSGASRVRECAGTLNVINGVNDGGRTDTDSSGYGLIWRYWSRLYPKIVDTDGNPLENATITISDSEYYKTWAAKSNVTGLVNESKNRFNLSYVLAVNQTQHEFYGITNHSTDANPSIITVSAPGYLTNITYRNMSADWGNASVPIEFELEPDLSAANQTIRAYDQTATVTNNVTSQFPWGNTTYFNGTITLPVDVTDCYVNVTVYNLTNASQSTLLATTTQNFTASVPVNLTEINGGTLLSWVPTTDGQYYARLNTWKANEVTNANVSVDFVVANTTITYTTVEQVFIAGESPTPVAMFSYELEGSLEVQFNDISHEPNNFQTIRWEWDFGDGKTSNIQNPSHTYSRAGTYTVSLEITDRKGETSDYSQDVTVEVVGLGALAFLIIAGFICAIIILTAYYMRTKENKNLRNLIIGIFIAIIVMVSFVMLQFTTQLGA